MGMKFVTVLGLFISCWLFSNVVSCSSYKNTVLFGTKTAYKDIWDYPWPNNDRPIVWKQRQGRRGHKDVQRCKPSHLNMIFRHGTRFPGKKDIRAFQVLESKINKIIRKSTGISPCVNVKFPWKNPYGISGEKQLTQEGDDELFNIGRRLALKFPEILTKPFAAQNFLFQSTCKRRCSQSAFAFTLGYLKGKGHLTQLRLQPVPILTKACDGDFLLRFYDNCPRYKKEVEDNSSTLIEMNKFAKGSHVLAVIKKIKDKLGLNRSEEINFQMVFAMYKACAFSVAIHRATLKSGWCSVFDESSFDVMEYLMDLKSYYESGPFYPITSSISCKLVKEIITTLKNSTSFRFAHSSTLLPLLTEMGFVDKGTPLTAENFVKMKSRVFRSGAISPFAANIAFVKYNCKDKNASYVRAFVNEKLAPISCCEDPYFCKMTEFESCFENITSSCNLSKMCAI